MRPYEPKDHAEVMRWFKARKGKEAEVPPEYFPETGFIVEGMAACFLYKTDSAVAYIDMLVSNPDVPVKDSREALDWAVWHCIKEAQQHGFKLLTGTTTLKAVADRAKKHGFDVWENYYQLSLIL